jgi:hypothetical protein
MGRQCRAANHIAVDRLSWRLQSPLQHHRRRGEVIPLAAPIGVLSVSLAASLLSGCATTIEGVTISDADRAACQASQDCTVWTLQELGDLVQRAYSAGARRARADKSGI